MENKSPTQETLNDDSYKTPYIEQKEKILKGIKENLNYIYIVLMIIANCIISLLKIEDGAVGIRYPNGGLGWVLWATQILITTFIGVMILGAFRRQGIKSGHKGIEKTYNEYLKVITQDTQNINPRSLKQYLRSQTIKDSLSKGVIFITLNLLVISLAISANLNALLSLIVNIIFAISFGLKSMLDAEEYVLTELVIWYKLKIQEITKLEENNKKEKNKNVEQLQRISKGDKQPRARQSVSNRVQQTQKPRTRRENKNNKLSA